MTHFLKLIAEWEFFEDAAFRAEWRLERTLDAYCAANGPPPSAMDVAAAKRLRVIARHRLRWLLHQTQQARAAAALI